MARANLRGLVPPLLAVLVAACATTKAPTVARAPTPAKPTTTRRLAWMPLEARVAPEIASAINQRLARVTVPGVSETFQSPVSMEMAQLAIECIDRAPRCYAAVGRSVRADELAWSELAHGKGHDASVTVRVSLFDVASGAVVRQNSRTFPSAKAARDGVAAFIDGTFGAAVASVGAAR
jgi:hypothetical protein